jgi:AcrR family transcriptional regulator
MVRETARIRLPLWATEARAGAKLDARLHLLDAAARAFMRGGYAGTTLDDVARANEVTKGQIYHYYRSKIDLYFDVVVAAFFMVNEQVQPVAARNDWPADRRLHGMAHAHAMVVMTKLPYQKVALDAAQHRPHANASLRQHRAMERIVRLRREYQTMVEQTVGDGMQSGVFAAPSAVLATRAVLGALNWLTVWYDPSRSSGRADDEAIAEQTADFVVAGLQPDTLRFAEFAAAARRDGHPAISEAC